MGKKPTSPSYIYAIKCEATNRIYIGRTQRSVTGRINEHFYDLKGGYKGKRSSPGSKAWQEDYDKYGADSFVGMILSENIPPEMCDSEEDRFIQKYMSFNPQYGYNARKNIKDHSSCAIRFVGLVKEE